MDFDERYKILLDKIWFSKGTKDELIGDLVSLKVIHDKQIKEIINESSKCDRQISL
jgi:hypothetical protein